MQPSLRSPFECRRERVMHRILGQIEIAEHPFKSLMTSSQGFQESISLRQVRLGGGSLPMGSLP
jgi:hypothetical protein